jgi:hypothetical protein
MLRSTRDDTNREVARRAISRIGTDLREADANDLLRLSGLSGIVDPQ